MFFFFFFSSRRRHTRYWRDWSSDVCSSDLRAPIALHDDDGMLWKQVYTTRDPDLSLKDGQTFEVGGATLHEIGRASCRGKSVDLGGRRIIKKKKINI